MRTRVRAWLRHHYTRQYLARRWPLDTHVVICGFPRSGTTLLHLMVSTTVQAATTFPKERNALGVGGKREARGQPWLITKRPADLLRLPEIRERYRRLGHTRVRFILCTRDPRAVLTSVHQNTVGGYYVTPERWSHLADAFDRAAQSPDVRVVEFADLITRPDWVQRTLTDWLGWRIEGHFAKALQHIPKDFDTAALNGVRPLDPQTLTAWQRPEHQARLRDIEAALPHLPEWLHTHGYHA